MPPPTSPDRSPTQRAQPSAVAVHLAIAATVTLAAVGIADARVRQAPFGLDLTGTLVVHAEFVDATSIPDQAAAHAAAMAAVIALDGVDYALPVATLPFGPRIAMLVAVPGRDENPWNGRQLPYLNPVHPRYFEALGIEVVAGRGLEPTDDVATASPVVVVEARMAGFLWPGEDPLGKCFHVLEAPPPGAGSGARQRRAAPEVEGVGGEAPPTSACRQVVGVVADSARDRNDDGTSVMQYYMPFSQFPLPDGFDTLPFWGLVVRTAGDPAAATQAVRDAVVASSSSIRGADVRPMTAFIDG